MAAPDRHASAKGGMKARRYDESGETLLEIVLALVVIALVVGAFFAAFATGSTSSDAHRDLATADTVLREYAELTKRAVRDTCDGTVTTFSVSYVPPPNASDFSVAPAPGATQTCPASVTTVKPITLDVTLPNGSTHKQMTIMVRRS
jgi:hypothetical protein